MADTFDLRPVDDAVAAAITAASGKQVGTEGAPVDPEYPYAVLYNQTASRSGPVLVDPDADAAVTYQVTCVALSEKQAKWMAARVRRALLARADGAFAHPIAPPGIRVMGRSGIDGSQSLDDERVGDLAVWSHSEQFVVFCTPLPG